MCYRIYIVALSSRKIILKYMAENNWDSEECLRSFQSPSCWVHLVDVKYYKVPTKNGSLQCGRLYLEKCDKPVAGLLLRFQLISTLVSEKPYFNSLFIGYWEQVGIKKTKNNHKMWFQRKQLCNMKFVNSYKAISMGQCKTDVTPMLTHWSYIFLALTHLYVSTSVVFCQAMCVTVISVSADDCHQINHILLDFSLTHMCINKLSHHWFR